MLKKAIGENAGKIWNALDEKPESSTFDLMKTTKIKAKDFYLALGWLAKENKVIFEEDNGDLKICLTENLT